MTELLPLSVFKKDPNAPLKTFPVLNQGNSAFSQKPQETTPKGYLQRVGDQYSQAAQEITQGVEQGAQKFSQGVQQGQSANLGTAVKGGLSAIGGLLTSGLRTAGGVAKAAFAPVTEAPGVKQGLQFAGDEILKIPGMDKVLSKAQELSVKYPELSKDIRNMIDIATVGAGKTVEKPLQTALQRTGQSLSESGASAQSYLDNAFAKKLVMPTETKAVKEAQVPRTTESGGLFKRDIVNPTTQEAESIANVAKIPGVSEKNTFQKNYNIIRDTNIVKAKELESSIAANDFLIPRIETKSRLKMAAQELEASPLIVGDAQKMAEKMLLKANQIVDAHGGTGSGLLAARKEFDSWVQSQKPKIFDANAENSLTTANRAIRNVFNTLLDEKAPDLGIKNALKEQSSLYRALDNIQGKAAEEANTVFGRSLQNIGRALGTRNKLVQTLAALTGIGVFGAASTYALPLTVGTGAGWLLYKGGRLVMNPEVRSTLGELLQKHSDQIAPVDRAVLQGLLNDFQDESSELDTATASASPEASKNPSQNIDLPSLEKFRNATR